MKPVIVSILAAGALALGACATTAEESAALSADQMRAELATISQQLDAIQATGRQDAARAAAQTRAAAFNAGSTGGFAVARVYEQSVQGSYERHTVSSRHRLGKTEQLMRRREQLQARLAKLNAAEVDDRS